MPAQELRLHLGEMTAQEERAARAAIGWANSQLWDTIDSLRADLAAAKDEADDIATLLRVSDSLLAAANARCAALEAERHLSESAGLANTETLEDNHE